jgi:predicted Zn finger-like uncharacterized protein
MSLVTRCPRCRTLFRVTPNQLQARSGRVRCGRCMNAFDAYDALAAETTNILPAPAAETETAAEPAPAPVDPSPVTAAAIAPTAPIAEPPPAPPPPPAQPAPVVTAAPDPKPEPEAEPRSRFVETFTHPTPAHLRLAGVAALALLLVLQMVFAYRSEIVARSPMVRSVLTSMCEHAGCRVSLPQRPELVRIEASDVHMVDANRPQLIQLTATLRSYAGYDLAYPALDLVLTNANEHALARRIFRPDEYLDASRDPDAGIPANAEITVALDLDTGDLNAAGFRLDLLAAPR